MVHRILRTMFSSGLMDFPMTPHVPSTHVDVAERGAEEGIVLLKNVQNLLPLRRNVRNILIVGAHANLGMLSGGGSSQVIPLGHNADNEVYVGGAVRILPNGAPIMPLGREIYDPTSPLAEIARESPRAKVRYIDGGDVLLAARRAAAAQIVIVFAQQWMTEGDDVPSLSLPGKQDELISAVAAANPRTIVVLETGGPVVMPWLDRVPAVLESWYAGSGGATALARILFGDVNPSGRLPITFPLAETQLPRPTLPDKNLAGRPFDVTYSEGADVGYRWFEQQKLQPLFPFGFGLSYTTFTFDKFAAQVGETVTANVTVTNAGDREGSETVQLYATPPTPDAVGRLVGWNKIDLKPGESKTVSITVEPRRLAHFDSNANVWRIEPGSYMFSLGRSATDIVASAQVTLAQREMKP
jgi:beta-glucosidase